MSQLKLHSLPLSRLRSGIEELRKIPRVMLLVHRGHRLRIEISARARMNSSTAIVWFRNDLRSIDNPALFEAASYARAKSRDHGFCRLLGLVTISAYELRGVHHWGLAKADYYLRTVASLRETLSKLRIPLIVHQVIPGEKAPASSGDYFAQLGQEMVRLAREHLAETFFWNEEYDGASKERDRTVEASLEAAGISVCKFHDQCAVPVGKVLTKTGTPYKVFSQFKRGWISYLENETALKASPSHFIIPPPEGQLAVTGQEEPRPIGEIPSTPPGFDLGELPTLEAVRRTFPAGEQAAHRQLERFLANFSHTYHEDRNHHGTDPAMGASRLSAPLAVGAISLRQCLVSARAANGGRLAEGGQPGLTCWINELCWRDFYRHVLVSFPHVAEGHAFRPEYEHLPWRGWEAEGATGRDEKAEDDFKRWCEGRTGVPIVDAAMRQLQEEAWQGNRVRMIVAMYLTKDLLIHWRRGERYFQEHLIDYDYSSNNGGWQWSASTGTDAQPYFRIFNPLLQSEKFDPQGDYIRKYVRELASLPAPAIHEPYERGQAKVAAGLGYPRPMVDHARAKEKAIALFIGEVNGLKGSGKGKKSPVREGPLDKLFNKKRSRMNDENPSD